MIQELEGVALQNRIGQHFLASDVHFFRGFLLAGGFNLQGDVLANAHVADFGQADVAHALSYGFPLGVEESFERHDVNFGAEFHEAVGLNTRFSRVENTRSKGMMNAKAAT